MGNFLFYLAHKSPALLLTSTEICHHSNYQHKTKSKDLTLSGRISTTVLNLFRFFSPELCKHAALLIIVRLFSNLGCWIVPHLIFLVKKTELIYLHYRLFYNCLCILVDFFAKNVQKDVLTVKKPKHIFKLFPEW